MNLVICGDFVDNGNSDFILSKRLERYLSKANFLCVNLEGPIAKGEKHGRLVKAGPHIYNSELSTIRLRNIGFSIFFLANNHIMDYGGEGLRRTLCILNENGGKCLGAGLSAAEAYVPLRIDTETDHISIINGCEAQFGVAKDILSIYPGYAWIGSAAFREIISREKERNQYTIVIAHGGLEDQPYPLLEWKDIYHALIDCGADMIIGNHPHIIQGKEIYKGKSIYYSLGNFFFPLHDDNNQEWYHSLMLTLDLENKNVEERILEFNTDGVIDFCNDDEWLLAFSRRTSQLQNEFFLRSWEDEIAQKNWNEYFENYYREALSMPIINLGNFKQKKISIKRIFKYFIYNIIRTIKSIHPTLNDTLLLHNLQIETNRFIVERYLYNKNQICNFHQNGGE